MYRDKNFSTLNQLFLDAYRKLYRSVGYSKVNQRMKKLKMRGGN